jgi:hypothetical protein
MDFHLDGLLNLPDITIERCIKNDTKTILKVSFLTIMLLVLTVNSPEMNSIRFVQS